MYWNMKSYVHTLLGCHHLINKGHFVIFLLIYEYMSVIIFTDITNFCGKLYFKKSISFIGGGHGHGGGGGGHGGGGHGGGGGGGGNF